MKRKLQIKPIYECRCNGRLQTKRVLRASHTLGLTVVKCRNGARLLFIETINNNSYFVKPKSGSQMFILIEFIMNQSESQR